jgi:lipoate synthase
MLLRGLFIDYITMLQLVLTTHGMCCSLVILATHILCVVSIMLQKACLLVVIGEYTEPSDRHRPVLLYCIG